MRQVTPNRDWMKPELIEGNARGLLDEYETQYGAISKPPILIEHLIEAYLGLTIDWDDISLAEGGVILACIDPVACTLRMNASQRSHFEDYVGTESFTLAHEAGHWRLHIFEGEGRQLGLFDDRQSEVFLCRGSAKGRPRDRLEWQADRFAAALLMPSNMVRDHVKMMDVYSWLNLYRMRDAFGVTITALRVRLEELGLLYVGPDDKPYPSREIYFGQVAMV